jgi:hypothetical protein
MTSTIVSVVFMTAVAAGAWLGGGIGVAIGASVTSAVLNPILCYLGIMRGGGTWGDVFRLAAYPLVIACVVFAVPIGLEIMMPRSLVRDALFILIAPPLTLLAYGLLLRALVPAAWKEIVERLGPVLARLGGAGRGRDVPMASA